MGMKGKFKRNLCISDYFLPPHLSGGLEEVDCFNRFFSLFCPPAEGAHKQLNEQAVAIGTEKQVPF